MTLKPTHDGAPQETIPTEAMGWSAELLSDGSEGWSDLLRRTAIGLSLSSLYGAALGLRQGGGALLEHALGVPLGLVLVGLLGAPSLFVFLSICRAPFDARAVAGAAVRGVASAGVVLAGLAPAVALFVVSSESPEAASGVVILGLLLGGGIALGRTVKDVAFGAVGGKALARLGGLVTAFGFAVFAITLGTRVWCAVLPILGGAS